jgi:hypothetical protein
MDLGERLRRRRKRRERTEIPERDLAPPLAAENALALKRDMTRDNVSGLSPR